MYMMKYSRFFFIITILLIGFVERVESYFYTNNFNASLNLSEWATNFYYGMEGLNNDTNVVRHSKIFVTNGVLVITNDPYFTCNTISEWTYNGFWTGNSVRYERSYSASSTNPFGFEVKRVWSDIDADANQGNPDSPPERCQAQLDIWLVQDNKPITSMWDTYDDFILFFENGMRGPNLGTQPPNHISRVGYFDGAPHYIDFAYSTNAYGQEINLTNHSIHSINWKYNWIGDNATERDATHLYATNHYPNTNEYIFRIVHDGEYVTIYINPDPDDNDGYPNEFCKVAQKRVLWNDNLKIILGHEVRNFKEHHRDVKYDYIRIVSAADKSKAYLDPKFIYPADKRMKFVFNITNDISPVNAGINYIEMNIPDGFVLDNLSENIIIKDYYKGNGELSKLRLIMFNNGKNYPDKNEVAIHLISKNKVGLIFGTTIKDNKKKMYENINIELSLKPQWASISDVSEFQIFVENRQFDGMPQTWGKSSTCGLQKCTGDLKVYKKSLNLTLSE